MRAFYEVELPVWRRRPLYTASDQDGDLHLLAALTTSNRRRGGGHRAARLQPPLRLRKGGLAVIVGEPEDLTALEGLAQEAQVPLKDASRMAVACRHVVDKFIGEDFAVVAPPLLLAPRRHPVFERLLDKSDDVSWSPPEDLLDRSDEEIADALDLPVDVVNAYPVLGFSDVLLGVVEQLRLSDEAAEAQGVHRFLGSWLDTFERRRYEVAGIGREDRFESWLVDHLDRVTPYNLELLARQWRSQARRRPDLICRVRTASERLPVGTVLVVELKSGVATEVAVDQVLRYLPVVRAEFAPSAPMVAGCIVADGMTVGLASRMLAEGIAYASAAELGYRDYLLSAANDEAPEERVDDGALPYSDALMQGEGSRLPTLRRTRGPWMVAGVSYLRRRDANRALAEQLGSYTPEQWIDAQIAHGLR